MELPSVPSDRIRRCRGHSTLQRQNTMRYYAAVLLCLAVVGGRADEEDHSRVCPDAEAIAPCVCSKACERCHALTTCSELSNLEQLSGVLERSRGSVIWDLTIEHSTFLYIPSETVASAQVRKLRLRDNVMTSLFDKAPPSSNQLQVLEISDLKIRRGVKWEVFSSLVHLEELNITGLELKRIDRSFTDHFPQGLTSLYFSDTNTKLLGESAFSRLSELLLLYVRNTKIKTLSRSMFPPHSKIMLMEFSGNRISSLPDDLFTNMPDLQGVELSRTNVVQIKESVFGNVISKLGVLSLEENRIVCDCEMKWVTKLKEKPMYLDGVCATPRTLKGKAIKNLNSKSFSHCA